MEFPPTRGGAGVYCEELGHATNALGKNIEIVAPKGSSLESSFKLTELPFNGSQDWNCSWKIIQFLKKQNLQEITLHIGDPGALRALIRFGWWLSKPAELIITIHGSEIPKFSRNFLEKILFIKLLQRANKVHVLSKYNKEKLIELCPKIYDRVNLTPGAPSSKLVPESKATEKRDYQKKHLVLLCVGRIHPRKGQLELLDTINQLPRYQKEKLTCQFVGPVKCKWYAQKLFAKSKASECEVQLLGELKDKDLQNIYQNADIFALTSIPMKNSVEGFGFVYLEASSHGLPILAHRLGGVEDAVIDSASGLLCDPNDNKKLLSNLQKLMEEPETRYALGNAGVKWAAKHSWKAIAQNLYD